MNTLIMILLVATAVFLILLVLVQRGRGGGLAGALGGMGGQSAFGAKAGDTFTKITMWTAFFWIVLCVVAVKLLTSAQDNLSTPDGLISRDPVGSTDIADDKDLSGALGEEEPLGKDKP